jgi:hypothetical protein
MHRVRASQARHGLTGKDRVNVDKKDAKELATTGQMKHGIGQAQVTGIRV